MHSKKILVQVHSKEPWRMWHDGSTLRSASAPQLHFIDGRHRFGVHTKVLSKGIPADTASFVGTTRSRSAVSLDLQSALMIVRSTARYDGTRHCTLPRSRIWPFATGHSSAPLSSQLPFARRAGVTTQAGLTLAMRCTERGCKKWHFHPKL